ncbi:uncharacterized protein [Ptychodera flava]|uniref:uncharacterized protein n=1 Tax=Ptychodera flava TaxID=63121 RepID=UPI00396A4C21
MTATKLAAENLNAINFDVVLITPKVFGAPSQSLVQYYPRRDFHVDRTWTMQMTVLIETAACFKKVETGVIVFLKVAAMTTGVVVTYRTAIIQKALECSSLEVKDRINCGNYGEAACISRGCCYESSHSPACFYPTTCRDHYFNREQACIDCNCADVCYKDNGRCDSSCNTGYIGMDCQSDGSPTIIALNQKTIENSGQPATFSCDVRGNIVHANETVLVVLSTAYTYTSTSGGSHPRYIRTNTFGEAVVSKGDNVTCQVQAHGGHDELSIEVEAFGKNTESFRTDTEQ